MYLKVLELKHFRNYSEQMIEFNGSKTIIIGENAQGKSNLLESVELLATLKSHRTSRDRDLIQSGYVISQILAHVQGTVTVNDLSLTFQAQGGRIINMNGEKVKRNIDFLGAINAVQFSSLDIDLVRGGPSERRNWLDNLLVQLEPIYAHIISQYHHVLRQRNSLLRQSLDVTPDHKTQLALWDTQLIALGTRVIRRRLRILSRLVPIAQHWHNTISGKTEKLLINYLPNVPALLDEPAAIQAVFLEKIRQRTTAEQYQKVTLVGPHRDDIEFMINDIPAKQYGSQGQQRTLVLALKLAELEMIESVLGEPPLLLLDDVLAELDLKRQNLLLEAVEDRFQTLITTTHLGLFDASWLRSSQTLTVKSGQVFIN
jgi:DNA replication and repair protein RecF